MMSKANPILKILENSSEKELTLAEILTLGPNLARRTAQRWIAELIKQKKIMAEGKGRSRRYKLIPVLPESSDFPEYIPLSPDSQDVLTYIRQPLLARKPVGYQRDFLISYQPGKTWYLPEPLRRQLHQIGNMGSNQLPGGTYGRDILHRVLIDLSWASSHLEGNTYSLLDTRELIEHGKIAKNKAVIETQMILNHKTAIEFIFENLASLNFDRFTIFSLHSALSENLLPNPADEGRIRQHMVAIGKSVYRPLSIPAQLEEMLNQFLVKTNQINDPFEQAFFTLVHIPYLQLFSDINKRTSRVAANIPLLKANLCPITFLGVPEEAYSPAILGIYELTRVELLRDLFMWAYERSTQEYLAVKREMVAPDPLRLHYRDVIRKIIHQVVKNYQQDAISLIQQHLEKNIPEKDRNNLQMLIFEELRRLHEGNLARYDLRPAEYSTWKKYKKA